AGRVLNLSDCPACSAARPATQSRLASGALFILLVLEEVLARDLLLCNRGKLDEEVDHLLLEDRRPYGRHGSRSLPVVVPDFLLAARNLAGSLDDSARDLLLRHCDLVLLA